MSEESGQVEQQQEESVDTSASMDTGSHEETQQAPTGEQVDTSKDESGESGGLGLHKKEPEAEVDSSEDFSKSLDGLVELALDGKLTDEQRQKLDEQGLGKHFDMIVSGHKAEIEKNDAEIVSVVGSKEAYSELQEWALSNLDDADIESFNLAVVESGDVRLAKLAVEGLKARYQAATGDSPSRRIESGGTANEENRPFANRDEYINETQSMKYRRDPEYAAQVEAKRNRSGF